MDINVTLVQSDLVWEDISANLVHFSEKLDQIKEQTDLIILPEMFTTGFSMHPNKFAEKMNGTTIQWMKTYASKLDAVITGSLIIEENGSYFNRGVWAQADGEIKYYDKKHLFNLAGEGKCYAAGSKRIITKIKGWKICPLICYDLRFPGWSRNKNDYDLLVYMANWPEPRREHWSTLLRARAIENQCYTIGVNRVGIDGKGHNYTGDSALIDPLGRTIIDISTKEFVGTSNLSMEHLRTVRQKLPFLKDQDL